MDSLENISIYYYDDPVITAFIVEEIADPYGGDEQVYNRCLMQLKQACQIIFELLTREQNS